MIELFTTGPEAVMRLGRVRNLWRPVRPEM